MLTNLDGAQQVSIGSMVEFHRMSARSKLSGLTVVPEFGGYVERSKYGLIVTRTKRENCLL